MKNDTKRTADTQKIYDAFGVEPRHDLATVYTKGNHIVSYRQIPGDAQVPQMSPRRRVQLICPEESITDQETAREFSMAAIKNKLEKNLPITNLAENVFYSLQPLKYTNLQDALDFQQQVSQHFESLPSAIRKEMGNDIRNFETYVNDPKNHETLVKHGLMSKHDASNNDVVNSIKDLKNSIAPDPSNPSPDVKKPSK